MVGPRASIVALAALVGAGCPSLGSFECRTPQECNRPELVGGQCLADGACAYSDDACASGLRRSPYASSRAGTCVPLPDTTGDASDASGVLDTDSGPERVTGGAIECQRGYAYRRELTIEAGAPVEAGHSIAVPLDHAALVAAGTSRSDGSDVRVFEVVDDCPVVELDRVADPRIGWNAADTRVWFAAPAAVATGEVQRGIFLYYGHDDPAPVANDWNAVFEVGSDFEGDELPPGLLASINPPGALSVDGGTLRVWYDALDIAAAAIVVLAEPLPDDRRFEFVNRARLVSGNDVDSNMKYFTLVASAQPPEVSLPEPEHDRRMISAQHLTSHAQGLAYTATDGAELSWDGAAWIGPSVFWGDAGLGTYTTHALVSSADEFYVVASDGDELLTTTTAVPWSSVRDPGGPHWLYMGEVFVDHYVCVAEYDWFFMRRTLDPEPTVTLGGESAL